MQESIAKPRDPLDEYAEWNRLDVNENANRYQGPSSFFAWLLDNYTERDALSLLPSHILKAHMDGVIYVHKLPYSVWIPYCTGHSIAGLLKKGLKTPTVISRPARHLDTLVDHVANFLITMQHYFTGAQALSSVEWYAGPFIRVDKPDDKAIKQQVQRLLFNLNYPTRIGLQTPFTNFTVTMNAPKKMLEGDKAIYGGEEVGLIGEYEEEAKRFIKVLTKLYLEGDAVGQPFTFPIPTLMVTAKWIWEDPELHELIFKTTAKRGSFYWLNTRIVDADASYAMCLHESEKITLKDGDVVRVVTMGELFDEYAGERESVDPDGAEWYKPVKEFGVLAFDFESKAVEWRSVKRFLVKKSKRAIRIKLGDGRVFIVTPDHPIPVYCKYTKRVDLKKAEDLLGVEQPGIYEIPVLMHELPGKYIKLKGEIEITVDEEFARFLGLYYGGGTLIRNKYNAMRMKNPNEIRGESYLSGVQFSLDKSKVESINFITSYATKNGWSIREWDDPRYPSTHYIAIYSAPLARLLWDNGISPHSDEKRIPWFIYASPPSVRLSFLKGLLEADGYFRLKTMSKMQARWELHIGNRDLVEDIVLLASITGISTFIRGNKDGSEVIYIPAKPDGSFETSNPLRHRKEGPIAWVSIKSVEEVVFDSDQRFIDIEVEGIHYFVHSSGAITHNCCRISIDKSELMYAYQNALRTGSKFTLSALKRDLEQVREDYWSKIERQRFGGLWAMPDITGSVNVVDVNLPRIALEAGREESRFWELYSERLKLIKEAVDWFRSRYIRIMKQYPNFYAMIPEYMPGFPSSHFNTIGIIGLPEAAALLMGEPKLWLDGSRRDWLRAAELMRRMVEYATKHARDWMMEEGVPWNVEEVPGESAAPKLAIKDLKLYPELREYLPAEPLYSTSIAPYYSDMELPDRIEVEQRVQKYFTGGVMMHIFLGEEADPEALANLAKRLIDTDIVYWSFTPAITHCNNCDATFTGIYKTCPKCSSENVDIWSRIIGYYRPLRNWNPYRRREFWQRKHYSF
ncbi:MAG: anaerobic ribonucleoside triphosphate reductase [Thermosphaera sp.]|nr:anaerobic ribonucleoside triphosphate reductase [Thermosphaera sp.]